MHEPKSHDAVIIVPGIMGSALIDTRSGRQIWGLDDPRWYLQTWTRRNGLSPLYLTPEEVAGSYGRVKASGLLRFPAISPRLGGFEPYHDLLETVYGEVLHPDAVLEYAYDWRLPVAYHARRFADAAHEHLRRWRRHAAHPSGSRLRAEDAIKLVVIAHSMGGLVVQEACALGLEEFDLAAEIRWTVTLGAPFYGSLKTALLLAEGADAPLHLPKAKAQRLAVGLPAVYDLLPIYRCVDEQETARPLSKDDAEVLQCHAGELDRASKGRRAAVGTPIPGHLQVVGTHQQTLQSLTLEAGRFVAHRYTVKPDGYGGLVRLDLSGDATVSTDAAVLPGTREMPVVQSHGGLPRAREVGEIVGHVLRHGLEGERFPPWLGEGGPGVESPDVVTAGEVFEVGIEGIERRSDAQCRITNLYRNQPVGRVDVTRDGSAFVVRTTLEEPGFYRIEVAAGGSSPVAQHILVTDGAQADG